MIGIQYKEGMFDYTDHFLLYKNLIVKPNRVTVSPLSINFFCSDERNFGRIFLKNIRIEEFEDMLIHRDDLKDYAEYMI